MTLRLASPSGFPFIHFIKGLRLQRKVKEIEAHTSEGTGSNPNPRMVTRKGETAITPNDDADDQSK